SVAHRRPPRRHHAFTFTQPANQASQMKPMKLVRCTFALLALATTAQAQDPLPSWNDTAPKKAIAAFVEKVTKEGSADFVPPNKRIATFDKHGTLLSEAPDS